MAGASRNDKPSGKPSATPEVSSTPAADPKPPAKPSNKSKAFDPSATYAVAKGKICHCLRGALASGEEVRKGDFQPEDLKGLVAKGVLVKV